MRKNVYDLGPTKGPDMDHCPLSRLPAELRNCIYELVLSTHRTVNTGSSDPTGPLSHPLTHVCRRMRQETLLMDCDLLLLSPIFHVAPAQQVTAWMRSIGLKVCSDIHKLDSCIISVAHLKELNAVAAESVLAKGYLLPKKATIGEDFEVHDISVLPPGFYTQDAKIPALLKTLAELGVSMCAVSIAYESESCWWREWRVVTLPYTGYDLYRNLRNVASIERYTTTECDCAMSPARTVVDCENTRRSRWTGRM
ncbi:hypothetical protein LTS10_001514 [Elasticomyces elasticus]|nr:hypothetical protein LTS10_001514 [Elasticomyces elasticus]